MLNSYGIIAARDYLLSGRPLTRLEATVFFAAADLTKLISDLRRQGERVERRTIPLAEAIARVNQSATLIPPEALRIKDIQVTEYRIER